MSISNLTFNRSAFIAHTYILSIFQIPFILKTVYCITHNMLTTGFHHFLKEAPVVYDQPSTFNTQGIFHILLSIHVYNLLP